MAMAQVGNVTGRGRAEGLRTWLAALLCALGCLAALAWGGTTAQAASFAEAGAAPTLSVSCQAGGKAQAGVSFDLYRVADVSEDLQFSATGEFARYAIGLAGLDSSGYKAAAETLAAYAVRDACRPLARGVTDEEGTLAFPSDGTSLAAGLYLLVGQSFVADGRLWSQEPALVCLPFPDGKGGWASEAAVAPKVSDEGSVTSLAVHKAWDDGDAADRPGSVTVQLLCDGSVSDEAELTAADDWLHTWSDLAPGHVWSAVEKDVPDGYAVTVQREGSEVVITNAKAPAPTGETKLPQTGQTWWPVPVLLCLGLACLAVGVIRRRSGQDGPRG